MNGRAHTRGLLAAYSVPMVAVLGLADCAPTQPYVVTQQSTRISEPEIHARIKAANPKYSGAGKVLKDSNGVIWGLDISESSVTTLEPLRGMQLTALSCPQNDISDLAPLKGMKLLQLVLDDDPITDLSPLSGMPLWKLDIRRTKVTDLGPLAGMQLQELAFSPEKVTKGIDVVRNMKSITAFPMPEHPDDPRIGFGCSAKVMSAEAFWKLYEKPRCSAGTIVKGDGCEAGCAGGKVLAKDHCCWPGQDWSAGKGACDGDVKCPEGTAWDGGKCARYTILDSDLARDNKTGLVWMRKTYEPGAPFRIGEFCSGKGMRLPTKEEALAISGSSCDGAIFNGWNTWTSSPSGNNGLAVVSFSGATGGLTSSGLGSYVLCVR
jgi:hypothetical protein